MQLEPNSAWPPKGTERVMADIAAWSAWYAGDVEALDKAYAPTTQTTDRQTLRRKTRWWGRARTGHPTGARKHVLHLPIAADLASTSADLLYADHPVLTHDTASVQDRLSVIQNEEFFDTILTGAEIGAALGGRYHRVTWDREVAPDAPFITTIDADAAYPTFRWGRLVDVSFVTEVKRDQHQVWRHVEHHYLRHGYGQISHALHEGTPNNLGHVVPLADLPETEHLAAIVNEDGEVQQTTPTPGLFVAYFPNLTPQRTWRKDQFGRYLGRSDLDGVEDFMDAADETWNSLMRDVRLGKGRIMIAEHLLGDLDGTPMFDLEQEAFTKLTTIAQPNSTLPIEQVQLAIRVDEHLKVIDRLTATIIHQAGYSSSTFTEHTGDTDITATEVRAREKRSLTRRDRKIAKETPALRQLLTKLLAVDAVEFNNGRDLATITTEPVRVDFPTGVQETPLELARTNRELRNARAASTYTLVKYQNPGWADAEIEAEVQRIIDEENPPLADPATVYPHGSYTPSPTARGD